MKVKKQKILFIVPLPPPVHGSSVISQFLKDSRLINDEFECDFINLSTSRIISEIGRMSPIKLYRLIAPLIILFWKLLTIKYHLCYLAITCHGVGFLKDAPFVLLCKLFRKKIIIHQHNKGMSEDIDKWPYKSLFPIVYKGVNVILLSWRLFPDIERIVPREKVFVCPNGIPDIEYEYKQRNNEVPRLLFLSNLLESKGVIVLLDALKLLKNEGYSYTCDYVGSETKEIDRKRMIEEINKRGLNQNVFYKGMKIGSEKDECFSGADIFVFPTMNEAFGLVNLEAMAHQIPIVTTDEGGIPDVVKDGENGLISLKNSPKSLAHNIEILLKDKSLREKYGKKGRDYFERNFSLHSFEVRMKEILLSC